MKSGKKRKKNQGEKKELKEGKKMEKWNRRKK